MDAAAPKGRRLDGQRPDARRRSHPRPPLFSTGVDRAHPHDSPPGSVRLAGQPRTAIVGSKSAPSMPLRGARQGRRSHPTRDPRPPAGRAPSLDGLVGRPGLKGDSAKGGLAAPICGEGDMRRSLTISSVERSCLRNRSDRPRAVVGGCERLGTHSILDQHRGPVHAAATLSGESN
jgi:hypothetical protein